MAAEKRPRERQFAMMPCNMDEWAGWTDLEPLEQWAYQLLRRQRDISQAGTLSLRLSRWAHESAGMSVDILRNLLIGLAAKDYIVLDLDYDEVLLCWFMTTDHVYRKPNSMSSAATAVSYLKSPGIKSALYAELIKLDKDGVVPVPQVAAVRWLIGQLESFALIDTRQPMHTPSTRPPQLVPAGSGQRAHAESSESARNPLGSGTLSGQPAEPAQTRRETGQNNRSTREASLTSVPVVGNGLDVRLKTEDEKPLAPRGATESAQSLIADAPPAASPAESAEPPHAGTVVSAYVDGAIAAQQPEPTASLKARVGKQARTMLAEGTPIGRLTTAAWRMGAAGWNDLGVQVQRDAATVNGNGQSGAHARQSVGDARIAEGAALKAKLRQSMAGGQELAR